MTIKPALSYKEFLQQVSKKFGSKTRLKFVDDEGMKVNLIDESDYDLAIETARAASKGKSEGKLVLYVEPRFSPNGHLI